MRVPLVEEPTEQGCRSSHSSTEKQMRHKDFDRQCWLTHQTFHQSQPHHRKLPATQKSYMQTHKIC